METFIIAEAGSNHGKKFDQALKLIDTAVKAGADACKFQTYSSETLYSKNTPDFAGHTNIPKLIKDIELPREWQKDLKQYCDEQNIEFMSTPFDEQAVDELVNLGVKRLKIAGFESTDFRFVDMVCSAQLPIIASLGIGSSYLTINRILEITDKYGIKDVTFLHCNNAYPTPPEDICLDNIKVLSKDKRYKTGLSDHTTSPLTPALAVTAGATVIEKHFTLDKNLQGPDHPFAVEPHELNEMVQHIRYAEKCLGYKKGFSSSEENFKKAMRSVIASKPIKKGELLTTDNLTTKRPFLEGNVPASEWFNILNTVSSKDYFPDDFI
jgi:N,N'-diacetyllegionaminate synthase